MVGRPHCHPSPSLRPDRHLLAKIERRKDNDYHQSERLLPWYPTNEYIEVSDEVAAELRAGKLAEAAHAERVRYNKSYYSLDCDDGIEYSACVHEPSPQELLERMDRFCHLWNALNSLPEIQGRRVDATSFLARATVGLLGREKAWTKRRPQFRLVRIEAMKNI